MFVIVRHGNTFTAEEAPRRIGARTDIPLTDSGQEQARALGALFAERGWKFDQVLTSRLLRTQQTTAAILTSQRSAIVPQIADFLREIDHGPDEGKVEEDVLARIGQGALSAWDDNAVPPPGWVVDHQMRIDAWRKLFAANRAVDQKVLLVTSNGAARFALMADTALQAAADKLPSLKMPTGSFSVIRSDNTDGLIVDGWGIRP